MVCLCYGDDGRFVPQHNMNSVNLHPQPPCSAIIIFVIILGFFELYFSLVHIPASIEGIDGTPISNAPWLQGGDIHGKSRFNFTSALFITTHMSEAHSWYLRACWPTALQISSLLNSSDVIVYLSIGQNNTQQRDYSMLTLQQVFVNQTLIVHVKDNPGYQEGALAAMKDAMDEQWLQPYDWIIRLNPDVIIRNDSFLLHTMQTDHNASAILLDCDPEKPLRLINTDFFAIKPTALSGDAFQNVSLGEGISAESHFSHDLQSSIINKRQHRWLVNSQPNHHTCRAGLGRDKKTADVIHHHLGVDLSRPWARMPNVDKRKLDCPVPF